MARDRLAAMRAQQQQGGGSPFGSDTSAPTTRQTRAPNPYDDRGSESEQGSAGQLGGQYNQGGYSQQQSYGQQGGYGQQQSYGTEKPSFNNQQSSYSTPQRSNNAYEMGPVGNGDPNSVPSMSEFLDEISAISEEISKYDANISQISRLHLSSLNTVNGSGNNQQLDNLAEDMEISGSAIANRIKALQRRPMPAKSAGQRKQQLEFVNKKFRDSLQRYRAEEKLCRDKYKERTARQFKIVKPNATEEEVQQVVNSDQGLSIFSQATMSDRFADSQSVYREVQDRHARIQQIERSIEQLARLFQDMSELIQQQDDTIIIIEETTAQVAVDTNKAEGHTQQARLSAIAYRKKRWICFFLTLIILAIIGIVVGVEVANHTSSKSNNNSSG